MVLGRSELGPSLDIIALQQSVTHSHHPTMVHGLIMFADVSDDASKALDEVAAVTVRWRQALEREWRRVFGGTIRAISAPSSSLRRARVNQ